MSTKTPIISQIQWLSALPQLLLLGFFIYLYYIIGIILPFIFGPLTYLFLSYGIRNLITRYHQRGIKLVKQGKFSDAISYFEKSVDYFTKYAWIDKYRFITLLSSSKMTYREMGLCNIAFCYSQTDKGSKAKEFYRLALKEYPDNILAKTALNFIDSINKN